MAVDPLVAAAQRIAAQHYGGRPPALWLKRLAPFLNQSAAGRQFLGQGSVGMPTPRTRRTGRTPY